MYLYIFKQKQKSRAATGYKIRTTKWDHASISVSMEDKCEALITVGRNATREVRDLEVVSKNGMISVDLFSNKIFIATNSKFDDGTFVNEESYNKRDHLLLEHKNFYKSIQEKSSPLVNLKDGLNAVHLVDCTLKALETKKSETVKSVE